MKDSNLVAVITTAIAGIVISVCIAFMARCEMHRHDANFEMGRKSNVFFDIPSSEEIKDE